MVMEVVVPPPSIDPEGFRVMAKIMGYTDEWVDEHIRRDKLFVKELNEKYPYKKEKTCE